jgi:biopolymer transport protein ExbD
MASFVPAGLRVSRRKSLDAELNLVPFIDLLSCLISFLLISAVWTRISAAPAHSTGDLQTEPSEDERVMPLRVLMTPSGYYVFAAAVTAEIPKRTGSGTPAYDSERLTAEVRRIKDAFPALRAVTLSAEDSVSSEDLIGTIDRITEAGLPDVEVAPASG